MSFVYKGKEDILHVFEGKINNTKVIIRSVKRLSSKDLFDIGRDMKKEFKLYES